MDFSGERDPDLRQALLERRADRVRELTHAAEVVLLGYDDDEVLIHLEWQPESFRHLPGVRSTPATTPTGRHA